MKVYDNYMHNSRSWGSNFQAKVLYRIQKFAHVHYFELVQSYRYSILMHRCSGKLTYTINNTDMHGRSNQMY